MSILLFPKSAKSPLVVREASDESEEATRREEERRERLRRAHAIATELLDTEKHYVAILHLIDQVIIIKPISDYHSISRPSTPLGFL